MQLHALLHDVNESGNAKRKMLRQVHAFVIVLLAAFGTAETLAAEDAPIARRQVIVLFNPSDAAGPRADEIVDAVRGLAPNPILSSRVGHPVYASRVLEGISSSASRDELARNPNSRRGLMEEYVVLTFPTEELATAALAALQRDQSVLSAEPNRSYVLSGSKPNDKYYAQDPLFPAAGNYQWGMQLLNMPAAWAMERGTAYVGAIDGGIDCGGNNPCTQAGLHPDLAQNTRVHFSKNFSWTGTVVVDDHIDQCSANGCYEVHGTHVAGIIAATPEYGAFTNGQNNTGVAGTCWTCSLAMLRLSDGNDATYGAAMTYAVDHGLQVFNMSWGDAYDKDYTSCSTPGNYYWRCQALAHAVDLDVVGVGAAGNRYDNRIQFPARANTVIAVGGLEYPSAFFRDGYGRGPGFPGNPCVPGTSGDECGSNYGTQDDGTPQIVAPAKDVVSTVFRLRDYNTNVHCGDSYGPESGSLNGYGDCTGTSMSAPHVTGLVGLARSANPLLSMSVVKSIVLTNTTACTGTDSSKCGNGFPNAQMVVSAALGGQSVKNRLTPLFSFYSAAASDHFYTIAPQMANAALNSGRLLPQPPSASIAYGPIGAATPGYSQFPVPPSCFSPCPSASTPRAMVSVFTSHADPTNGSAELVPLYRMSWKCASACTHVSHFYATNSSDIATAQSVGYVIDGIEGYVYPKSKAQPPGTVKLCRKYAQAPRDDYVLFAGTGTNGATCGTNDGYTKDAYGNLINDYIYTFGTTDSIGWVYPVVAPRPMYSTGYLATLSLLLD